MRPLTLLFPIAMPILLIGCTEPSTSLSKEDLVSFNAKLAEEIKLFVADWQARQADNLKYHTTEFPKTSAEEIQREVSKGAEYVFSRINNRQPVLLLICETEITQPQIVWTLIEYDQLKVTPRRDSEFHLPFDTYEFSLSSASMPLQRKGREIALRWLYSRKVFPVNMPR